MAEVSAYNGLHHAVVVDFDKRTLWGQLVYAIDERGRNVVDAISAALIAKERSVAHQLRKHHNEREVIVTDFHSTSVHGMRSMEDDLPKLGQLVKVQLNQDQRLLSVWYQE